MVQTVFFWGLDSLTPPFEKKGVLSHDWTLAGPHVELDC